MSQKTIDRFFYAMFGIVLLGAGVVAFGPSFGINLGPPNQWSAGLDFTTRDNTRYAGVVYVHYYGDPNCTVQNFMVASNKAGSTMSRADFSTMITSGDYRRLEKAAEVIFPSLPPIHTAIACGRADYVFRGMYHLREAPLE